MEFHVVYLRVTPRGYLHMNSHLGAEWPAYWRHQELCNSRRAFSEQPELVRLKWMVAVSDAIFGPILHRKRLSGSSTTVSLAPGL
jgi:hypothetical protein